MHRAPDLKQGTSVLPRIFYCKMAAPLEVIVSSDSSSHLWNLTVFDLHSGSSLLSYRGGNSSARTLTLLRGQYILSAQLGKNFINVWEIQRKVRTQCSQLGIRSTEFILTSRVCLAPLKTFSWPTWSSEHQITPVDGPNVGVSIAIRPLLWNHTWRWKHSSVRKKTVSNAADALSTLAKLIVRTGRASF